MALHRDLAFIQLHKAKISTTEELSVPIAPDGIGDAHWSPETEILRLSNLAGDDWMAYDLGDISGGGGGAVALDDLTDVNASSPTNNQVLTWNSGSSRWIAQFVSIAYALTDLTDVTVSGATKGSLLVKTSGDWINIPVGTDAQILMADSGTASGVKWGTFSTFDNIMSDGNGDVLTDGNGNVLSL